MSLFLSLLPIIILLVLLLKKNSMPAFYALPLVAILALVIFIGYFGNPVIEALAAIFKGYALAITPISVVFFALFFSKILEVSGATMIIRNRLALINPNPIARVMIVGWALLIMLEGASGFGAPAAVVAPLLIALGFGPVRSIMFVLVVNALGVSFGGAAVPTWMGLSASGLATSELHLIAVKTAFIYFALALIIPVLALRFLVSTKSIIKSLGFIYLSILAVMIPYFIIAHYQIEVTALLGGAIGLVITIILANLGIGLSSDWHINKPLTTTPQSELALAEPTLPTKTEFNKAILPFLILIALLVVTHLDLIGVLPYLNIQEPLFSPIHLGVFDFTINKSLGIVTNNIFGTSLNNTYPTLLLPALIPFGILIVVTGFMYKLPATKISTIGKAVLTAVSKPWYALGSALTIVYLMNYGGDNSSFNIITSAIKNNLGSNWMFFAFYLGALGTFVAGSNTTSNLALSHFQTDIASHIGISQTNVLTMQNVGGAFGHMISLNYILSIKAVTGVSSFTAGYFFKRNLAIVFFVGLLSYLILNLFVTLNWFN